MLLLVCVLTILTGSIIPHIMHVEFAFQPLSVCLTFVLPSNDDESLERGMRVKRGAGSPLLRELLRMVLRYAFCFLLQ